MKLNELGKIMEYKEKLLKHYSDWRKLNIYPSYLLKQK